MPYYLECSISLQNCESLWPPISGHKLTQARDWQNGSCVRDQRLPGQVGRCGWPGAPCTVMNGSSDCGWGTPQVCPHGVCVGALGDPCSIDDNCNYGTYCNATTSSQNGTCGGAGAQVDTTDLSQGLDIGRDYCLSGLASQNASGVYLCDPGLFSNTTASSISLPATTSLTCTPMSVPVLTLTSTVTVHATGTANSALLGVVIGGPLGKVTLLLCLVVILMGM